MHRHLHFFADNSDGGIEPFKWPKMRSVKYIGNWTCIRQLGFPTENVRLIETQIPTYRIQNHQKYNRSRQFFRLVENPTYRCPTCRGTPVYLIVVSAHSLTADGPPTLRPQAVSRPQAVRPKALRCTCSGTARSRAGWLCQHNTTIAATGCDGA